MIINHQKTGLLNRVIEFYSRVNGMAVVKNLFLDRIRPVHCIWVP